jgi:hypothetical protein
MLTFLRKIRKSLIESGSARKYLLYASGEIALVVIGILIALQINIWNQARIERHQEELLLKEIHSEFLINKQDLTNTLQHYKRVYEKQESIIKSFPIDEQSHDLDSLALLLQRSNTVLDADLSEGTVSALINSSAFEIISNNELRTLLVQWKDLVADYQKAEAMAIKFTVEHYYPYMDEHIPANYREGLHDPRVDPSFLSSVQFENLIKRNRSYIRIMLFVSEGGDGKLLKAIDRIIELTTQN